MSSGRYMDFVCVSAMALAVLFALCPLLPGMADARAEKHVPGYEARLFDTQRVHTIDIQMDNWEEFIKTCENEEYHACTVVVDGEGFAGAGIRAKGNTSLSMVSGLNSSRYSFKIEFDHYDDGLTYYGLDKLSLNNLIQDNTFMKDYLTYAMMNAFGVNAPLASYAYITVNGEDWGLYLAVEGVEDAFLYRNYGAEAGELYKPDSLSMGGGRGNGKSFEMGEFAANDAATPESAAPNGAMPDWGQFPGGMQMPGIDEMPGMGEMPGIDEMPGMGEMPGIDEMPGMGEMPGIGEMQGIGAMPGMGEASDSMQRLGGGGMGAQDVKLQYIDDRPESYSNIFENAKTDVAGEDRMRLIFALKALGEGDAEASVEIESVIRYFVVHNFVVNEDSYTGSMVHNYYLHEQNGRLSMIPWDYNLAYGTFRGGSAADAVNDAVIFTDTDSISDRPMLSWIFESEEYTGMYTDSFSMFLESVDAQAMIDHAQALIAPYVEKDPTKFCTYEEFETGAAALGEFVRLRKESVLKQLAGEEAQVQTGSLKLSDMGTMGSGGGKREADGQTRVSSGAKDGTHAANEAGSAPSTSRTGQNAAAQQGASGRGGAASGKTGAEAQSAAIRQGASGGGRQIPQTETSGESGNVESDRKTRSRIDSGAFSGAQAPKEDARALSDIQLLIISAAVLLACCGAALIIKH